MDTRGEGSQEQLQEPTKLRNRVVENNDNTSSGGYSQCFLFQNQIRDWDTLIQKMDFYIMKINNFRVGLTDISAKKEALDIARLQLTYVSLILVTICHAYSAVRFLLVELIFLGYLDPTNIYLVQRHNFRGDLSSVAVLAEISLIAIQSV